MAITLVATAGSATANSYVTEAEAATYMESRLGSTAWPTDAEQQKAALISATNRLDQEQFVGDLADRLTPQRLKWPRTGATDPEGYSYPDDSIPRCLKDATCEMALVALAAPGKLGTGGDLDPFEALGVGGGAVSLTLRDTRAKDALLPPAVQRLLRHVLNAGTGQLRVVRA